MPASASAGRRRASRSAPPARSRSSQNARRKLLPLAQDGQPAQARLESLQAELSRTTCGRRGLAGPIPGRGRRRSPAPGRPTSSGRSRPRLARSHPAVSTCHLRFPVPARSRARIADHADPWGPQALILHDQFSQGRDAHMDIQAATCWNGCTAAHRRVTDVGQHLRVASPGRERDGARNPLPCRQPRRCWRRWPPPSPPLAPICWPDARCRRARVVQHRGRIPVRQCAWPVRGRLGAGAPARFAPRATERLAAPDGGSLLFCGSIYAARMG